MLRNTYQTMPTIPYNILKKLALDEKAENVWKILKYPTYDCLSKENLSLEEKLSMICIDENNQFDFNVFLSPLNEDMISDEKTILKVYKSRTELDYKGRAFYGIGIYRFDILFGGKMSVIEYNQAPCNRGDVLEMEILRCLNGAEIEGGIGYLEFNSKLSQSCMSAMTLGNHTTFLGTSLQMALKLYTLENENGCI